MDTKTPLQQIREILSDIVREQKWNRALIAQSKLNKTHSRTNALANEKRDRRASIRALHLAACFLRGTPYSKVERKTNPAKDPLNGWHSASWAVTDRLIDADYEPEDVYHLIETWIKGVEQ